MPVKYLPKPTTTDYNALRKLEYSQYREWATRCKLRSSVVVGNSEYSTIMTDRSEVDVNHVNETAVATGVRTEFATRIVKAWNEMIERDGSIEV